MAVSESSPEKTAPQPLYLVQRFVNSVDLMDAKGRPTPETEEFMTPEDLRAWLVERELMQPDEPVTEGDLRRALDVREGLRALLLANNGEELDDRAVECLDRAASRAGLRLEFCGRPHPTLIPDASGVDGAIAQLLAIVSTAVNDGNWERLKACPRENCFWAFYDRTKNRSGRWCNMDVCGNVEKARAYRERHKH
jgi:predicted RNA-binding Zn ribbon-like protein